MFAATVALAFVVAHVAGEIPSYIHVCGRRDPNLDECIVNNVNNLKSKICEGIPELSVQPTEPLHIEKIDVINTDTAKISLNDVYISGVCDYDIKSFHMNIEKLHFDVELIFKQINMSMMYNFNVNLIVPVALNGPVRISTDNVAAKANSDLKTVTKDGKDYIYVSNLNVDLDIKGYQADLSSLDNQQVNRIREIGQRFVGQSQQELIKAFKPVIEKIISQQILGVSNEIVKHFTYDELFPDRT